MASYDGFFDQVDGEDKKEQVALKKIRKYTNRDFLLQIGQSPTSKKKINDVDNAHILRDGGSNLDGYPQPPLNAQHEPATKSGMDTASPPGDDYANDTGNGYHYLKLLQLARIWICSPADRRNKCYYKNLNATDQHTISILKQTIAILNKLHPDNFFKLCDKFLKLELNAQDDRIMAVGEIIFEKAIDEPNFSTVYARLVLHVCMNSQETTKKFRKEILDQCQKEFQKTYKDEDEIKSAEAEISNAPEDTEQLKLELEEKRTQMRRRRLGNVRFIGELYKLHMLTPKIMLDCVQMLINNQDEESYECLCILLTTVGQKLDNQLKELEQRIRQAKATNQQLPKFIPPDDKFMDKKFAKLKQLSSDTAKLPSRIRFALLDVVELRENNWKPRRAGNVRKSSRFSAMTKAKPSEPILGGSPVLVPSMGDWGGGQPQNRSNSRLPTRLQNQQQQQQQNPMSSSFGDQQSHNNSGHLPQQQQMPNRFGPSMGSSSQPPNRFNMLSHQTSQPASQPPSPSPQHQQQQSSNIAEVLNLEPPTPEVNDTVKNIFFEYCSVKKYEDTMHWVKERFPGDKVVTFVDCLARQVGEMSKPEFQCGAGQLIKMLIKHKLIRRDLVLRVLTEGLIPDIPDIQVDCPKVTTYVAVFILQVFGDETNFNWLLELTRPLKEEGETMRDLIRVTLHQLTLQKNEEYVKSLWKMTDEGDSMYPLMYI